METSGGVRGINVSVAKFIGNEMLGLLSNSG